MEIQSAMSSGIEGFHKATVVADQAAKEILAQTTIEKSTAHDQSLAMQPSDLSGGSMANASSTYISNNESSNSDISDLNQSLVDLKVAQYQAKASAQVIKSADESLGTLIDVTA